MDEYFKQKTENTSGGKEREILVTELKKLMNKSSARDRIGFYNKIIQETKKLKNKYPGDNYEDYEMWHVLIGSTIVGSKKKFDFPENEIEKFIRSEYRNSQV